MGLSLGSGAGPLASGAGRAARKPCTLVVAKLQREDLEYYSRALAANKLLGKDMRAPSRLFKLRACAVQRHLSQLSGRQLRHLPEHENCKAIKYCAESD